MTGEEKLSLRLTLLVLVLGLVLSAFLARLGWELGGLLWLRMGL